MWVHPVLADVGTTDDMLLEQGLNTELALHDVRTLGSGVVVLGTIEDGKVALLAGVTKDLTSKLHAGKIIQAIAKEVGGSGGGRPDLAEAGGKDTPGLKSALDHVYPLIDQLL